MTVLRIASSLTDGRDILADDEAACRAPGRRQPGTELAADFASRGSSQRCAISMPQQVRASPASVLVAAPPPLRAGAVPDIAPTGEVEKRAGRGSFRHAERCTRRSEAGEWCHSGAWRKDRREVGRPLKRGSRPPCYPDGGP